MSQIPSTFSKSSFSSIVLLPPEFVSEITADKISQDGFNVENLLHYSTASNIFEDENIHQKSTPTTATNFFSATKKSEQGFMASTFVRPPINLRFRFRQSIALEALHLGLRVGNQKTTGLQLFVGQGGDQDRDLGRETEIQRRVGSFFLSDATSIRQCLFSRRRNEMEEKFVLAKNDDLEISYFTKCYLLDRIQILTIRILRSYFVPCLAYVRFYVRKDFLDEIKLILGPKIDILDQGKSITVQGESITGREESIMGNDGSISGQEKSIIDQNKSISRQEKLIEDKSSDQSIIIPEEFVDPITNICMSLPIILPSGHNIDRSTLDRYLEEESKYGRPATDPFTNVSFTNSSYPLPNGRLKERIDKFFLTYPDLAKEHDFGRTLCKGDQYEAISIEIKKRIDKETKLRNTFLKKSNFRVGQRGNVAGSSRLLPTDNVSVNADSDSGPEYLRNIMQDLPSFL